MTKNHLFKLINLFSMARSSHLEVAFLHFFAKHLQATSFVSHNTDIVVKINAYLV